MCEARNFDVPAEILTVPQILPSSEKVILEESKTKIVPPEQQLINEQQAVSENKNEIPYMVNLDNKIVQKKTNIEQKTNSKTPIKNSSKPNTVTFNVCECPKRNIKKVERLNL